MSDAQRERENLVYSRDSKVERMRSQVNIGRDIREMTRLIEILQTDKDQGRTRLFTVMFTWLINSLTCFYNKASLHINRCPSYSVNVEQIRVLGVHRAEGSARLELRGRSLCEPKNSPTGHDIDPPTCKLISGMIEERPWRSNSWRGSNSSSMRSPIRG